MKECEGCMKNIFANIFKINEFEFGINGWLGMWMEGQSEKDRKVVDIILDLRLSGKS
jgi:hypothetical protein